MTRRAVAVYSLLLALAGLALGLPGCGTSQPAPPRRVARAEGKTRKAPPPADVRPARLAKIPEVEILCVRGNWELQIIRAPSGGTKTLLDSSTAPKSITPAPQGKFSPDGRLIALTPSTNGDIWLYDRRTARLRRLSTDSQGYYDVEWSSDSRYLSARGNRGWTASDIPPTDTGRPISDLYLWNVCTRGRILLGKDVVSERWRNDGRALLFTYRLDWPGPVRTRIWDEQTGCIRNMRSGMSAYDRPEFRGGEDGGMASTIWSPDGTRGAFSDRDRNVLLDEPGKPLRKLVSNGGTPRWSPDGRWIVAVRTDPGSRSAHLQAVELSSGRVVQLGTYEGEVQFLGWLPDSRTVLVRQSNLDPAAVDARAASLGGKADRIVAVSATTGASAAIARLESDPARGVQAYNDWRPLSRR